MTKAPSTRNPIFLNPQLFLSGYGFRPHTRIRCIRHTNPQLFESVLQSGNFWIRNVSGNVRTLNPDIFLSTDVTRSSPLLYREFSRRSSEQRKICGFKNIRIGVDGQIRFESQIRVDVEICIRKEKVADSKISAYMLTGPKSSQPRKQRSEYEGAYGSTLGQCKEGMILVRLLCPSRSVTAL